MQITSHEDWNYGGRPRKEIPDIENILARINRGEPKRDIAAELKISVPTLLSRIKEHTGEVEPHPGPMSVDEFFKIRKLLGLRNKDISICLGITEYVVHSWYGIAKPVTIKGPEALCLRLLVANPELRKQLLTGRKAEKDKINKVRKKNLPMRRAEGRSGICTTCGVSVAAYISGAGRLFWRHQVNQKTRALGVNPCGQTPIVKENNGEPIASED